MPLHIIKKVTELVPEAGALVKRASLENNLPTTNKEETLMSALELEYMTKVANVKVDLEDAQRVCQAVDLYGLADEVRAHTQTMVKSASAIANNEAETIRQVEEAEHFVETQLLSMNPNMEKIAQVSEDLWDNYSDYIKNDKVKLYAGSGSLIKEAAVVALNHRAKRTGNQEFEKVASLIESTNVEALSIEDNRAIISAIRGLEKSASYMESNLYTDMFITKKASCVVDLCGKKVSADSLSALSGDVGSILGSDIGALLADCHQNIAAIEALPLGEKQAILGMIG